MIKIFTANEKQEIINQYKSGKTIEEIRQIYNCSYVSISEVVQSLFRRHIEDIKPKEIDKIIKLYADKVPMIYISEQLEISRKLISKILKDNNITKYRSFHTYKINEHYFDDINTPNKAYILGFLYADGNNSKSKGTIKLSLQASDVSILKAMNKEMDNETPLKFLHPKDRGNGYSYADIYSLSIHSIHVCETLEEKGMVPNKSLVLKFPIWLDKLLYPHFIRGYFDGDGSFCPRRTPKGGFQPLITITSTEQFCIQTQRIIQDTLHIPCGNIYDASCHNGITRVLSFSGGKQTKTFLDWIYKDADLYLQRKYDLYVNTFAA